MTHTDDDIKAAEKRGYSRGYQAKEHRIKREQMDSKNRREHEREHRAESAFRERAFLAALPAFIAAGGWEMDGRKITSLADKVELSWRAANESLKKRRR